MMDVVSKFLVIMTAAAAVTTTTTTMVSSLKMPQIGSNRLNNNFGGTGGASGVNRNTGNINGVVGGGGYNNNNNNNNNYRSPAARPTTTNGARGGPVASRSSPFNNNNNNNRSPVGGYQQRQQQPLRNGAAAAGRRMPPPNSPSSSSSALSFQAGGGRRQQVTPGYDNLYRDPPQPLSAPQRSTQSQLNMIARGDVLEKIREIIESEGYPLEDPNFDRMVKDTFPGAISNRELETRVVSVLNDRGFTAENTLLATSLCCDELARVLEDDFVRVYGNNFNLGGLAGFPFAGNTGYVLTSLLCFREEIFLSFSILFWIFFFNLSILVLICLLRPLFLDFLFVSLTTITTN